MPNANATTADAPPVRTRANRVVRASIFAVALGAFTFLLSSAHVPCGFARIFQTPCPGCGSTRAMLALASGDLHAFVRYNPLAPFMTLLVVVLGVQALSSLLATGTFRRVGEGRLGTLVPRAALVIAVLEFVVWVARFGGFLGGPVPVG
jgi:Protein of unknown function (DUF2752)